MDIGRASKNLKMHLEFKKYYENCHRQYNVGKFDECIKFYSIFLRELSAFRSQLEDDDARVTIIITETWECILASNNEVCCMLKEVDNTNVDTWNGLLCKYLDVYDCYKFMDSIPLQLRATMLYNCLYMYWLKESNLDVSFIYRIRYSCCQFIIDVLKKLDINVSEAGFWEELQLLGLMTDLSAHLLRLDAIECLVMMDILHLLLLIMRRNLPLEYVVEFSKRYADSLDQFETHFSSTKIDSMVISQKYGYYMFSFDKLNSRLDLKNYNKSILSFFVTLGYLNIQYRLYNEAVTVLEACKEFKPKATFTENLRLHFISYSTMQVMNFCKSRYVISSMLLNSKSGIIRTLLLSAMIDMKEEKYTDAIRKLMEIRQGKYRNKALFLLSLIYADVKQSVSQILCLGELVSKIEPNEIERYRTYEEFMVDVPFSNLADSYLDIHYNYARLNFEKGQFEAAYRSYNAILQTSIDVGIKPWLIRNRIITLRSLYHEAMITNMKINNWESAKKLGEVITNHTLPLNDKIKETNFTECFEEDVVGLVLLADVYEYENDLINTLDILNKCSCIIENVLETFPECNSEMKLYSKLLLVKILLRLSSLQRINDFSASMEYMKKAKELIPDYPDIPLVNLHSSNNEEGNYKNPYIDNCKHVVLKYILKKVINVPVADDETSSRLSTVADFCLDDENDELFVNL